MLCIYMLLIIVILTIIKIAQEPLRVNGKIVKTTNIYKGRYFETKNETRPPYRTLCIGDCILDAQTDMV